MVGFKFVYVDLETWLFIFLSKISICILELFDGIMFTPICNGTRNDLNGWIN